MDSLLLRIKEIADKEGITISFLEKQIGASKGVLSRAIKNNTDIQSKWIRLIVEKYPSYSASWLITGNGEKEVLKDGDHVYSTFCVHCAQKDQRISDLLQTIDSLKEANQLLKDLLTNFKDK